MTDHAHVTRFEIEFFSDLLRGSIFPEGELDDVTLTRLELRKTSGEPFAIEGSVIGWIDAHRQSRLVEQLFAPPRGTRLIKDERATGRERKRRDASQILNASRAQSGEHDQHRVVRDVFRRISSAQVPDAKGADARK